MALVRQCDRCGACFKPYHKEKSGTRPITYLRITSHYDTLEGKMDEETVTQFDLCESCEKHFYSWIGVQ